MVSSAGSGVFKRRELRRTTVQVGRRLRWWFILLLFLLAGEVAAVIYALWTTGMLDRMLGRADA